MNIGLIFVEHFYFSRIALMCKHVRFPIGYHLINKYSNYELCEYIIKFNCQKKYFKNKKKNVKDYSLCTYNQRTTTGQYIK
jgi:hypothetical protein